MSNNRECWDCFYCGESLGKNYKGEYEYRCNRTHSRTIGPNTCSYFVPDDNNHACYECMYFEYESYTGSTIFSRKTNYCTRKKKSVGHDDLACPYFIED